MKTNKTVISVISVILTFCLVSCVKDRSQVPPIKTGTYQLVRDQVSLDPSKGYIDDNITNISSCIETEQFIFSADKTFHVASSCFNLNGTWSWQPATKGSGTEIILKDQQGTIYIDGLLEDVTADSFICNEILIGFGADRFTFKLVK